MKRRGKYSFLKANAGNLIFFLLLVRWVLNKFYEHHWSLKHKDRQIHRAKETRPSLGRTEVCPCSQQVMHHMRKSKGIPALGSFQKAELVLRGQWTFPLRGDQQRGTASCPDKRHKILESGEMSWVQCSHPEVHRDLPEVWWCQLCRSPGLESELPT